MRWSITTRTSPAAIRNSAQGCQPGFAHSRSTSHRVVNPQPDRASHARYSMPFFLHFRSDFLIEPLPGTVPTGEQPKWQPITAHDYLQERLREIKLV